jgi:hypothetical protein
MIIDQSMLNLKMFDFQSMISMSLTDFNKFHQSLIYEFHSHNFQIK